MRKLCSFLTLCVLALASTNRGVSAIGVNVTLPSGNHSIRFSLRDGKPYYSVSCRSDVVLSDSGLSLSLGQEALSEKYVVESTRTESKKGSWVPVVGSKSSHPDAYHEIVVQLREASKSKRRLELTFRAYDEGVAFRYTIPKQEGFGSIKLQSDSSRFQFTDDHFGYSDDYP